MLSSSEVMFLQRRSSSVLKCSCAFVTVFAEWWKTRAENPYRANRRAQKPAHRSRSASIQARQSRVTSCQIQHSLQQVRQAQDGRPWEQ